MLGQTYKVGFYILMFGILFDVCTRYNYMAQTAIDGTKIATSPIELVTLLAACIVVGIMQVRRGVYSDDLRYLSARTFAETGQIAPSISIGVLIAVAATGGRIYSEIAINGWADVKWAGDVVMFIVMLAMFIPLILLITYLNWRSYRRQEDKLAAQSIDA